MHYIFVKCVADATLTILIILILIFFGVCPEQVAQQTLVGDVGRPLDHLDVTVFVEFLTETAVHTKDLVINKGRNR